MNVPTHSNGTKSGNRLLSLFRTEVLKTHSSGLHGEVVFTQALSTKLLAGALFAIIVIAALWLTLGNYARVETVPGMLVTDVPSAKVVASRQGTVSHLVVAEGEIVEKGDTLLIINTDREAAAGGNVAGRTLGSLDARLQLTKAQIAMVSNRATTERLGLADLIDAAEREAMGLSEQIALQQQVVASNNDIYERISQVAERGFVSRIEFESRRQTLLNSQQALGNLEQRHADALSEAKQARSRLASSTIEAAQSISQLRGNLETLSGEQARLQGEQSYVITAPISGRVTALATAEGRSAVPQRPLLVLVPEEAPLTAELYAPSRAIGFVEPGKEARLLYDAFPYQRFGSFEGEVSSISRIAIDPRETEIPFPFDEPVYRVRVKLDKQSIVAFDKSTPLQPGMTLQSNIVLERQSFLAWILQPLNAVLNRNS